MAGSSQRGELARLRPGERFILWPRDGDGVVMYRGTMLAGGAAEMDILSSRAVDPVVVTADELFQIYDPSVHEAASIGGAV